MNLYMEYRKRHKRYIFPAKKKELSCIKDVGKKTSKMYMWWGKKKIVFLSGSFLRVFEEA